MKRRKYKNTPVTVYGIKFDSEKEAVYYCHLKGRKAIGQVTDLELQPVFKFEINGVPVRIPSQTNPKGRQAKYTADFRFYDVQEGKQRVIDVKGYDTGASKLRRAFVKAIWGVDVEIV